MAVECFIYIGCVITLDYQTVGVNCMQYLAPCWLAVKKFRLWQQQSIGRMTCPCLLSRPLSPTGIRAEATARAAVNMPTRKNDLRILQ